MWGAIWFLIFFKIFVDITSCPVAIELVKLLIIFLVFSIVMKGIFIEFSVLCEIRSRIEIGSVFVLDKFFHMLLTFVLKNALLISAICLGLVTNLFFHVIFVGGFCLSFPARL